MTYENSSFVKSIRARKQAPAERIVGRQYETRPELWTTYGDVGRTKCVRDVVYHLSYLAEAIDAAQAGMSVQELYLHVFQPVQREMGRLWQINRLTIAQEHYVTAATQLIMSQSYPRILTTARVGRCQVASCVGGELHEIGVRMVADLFELAGWDSFLKAAATASNEPSSDDRANQAISHADELSERLVV